jgi:hypothetical protein
MLPGWGELIETAEHLLHDGHLPHSESHEVVANAEQHTTDTEHGCTPTSHHCECHTSIPVLPTAPPPELKPIMTVAVLDWWPWEDLLISRSDPPPRLPPTA